MQQGQHKLVPIDEIILDKSNPRIALWLEMYEGEPTPEQIHQALGAGVDDKESQGGTKFSTLKNSIQTNGGIIQPVILNTLTSGKLVCVEGNTRVCLYKSFRDQKAKGSWDKIPSIVYKNLDEEAVDAIRLQAHLVGPRQWDHTALNKITRFRHWVVEGDTKRDIKNAPEKVRQQIGWELKKIKAQVATLLKVAR